MPIVMYVKVLYIYYRLNDIIASCQSYDTYTRNTHAHISTILTFFISSIVLINCTCREQQTQHNFIHSTFLAIHAKDHMKWTSLCFTELDSYKTKVNNLVVVTIVLLISSRLVVKTLYNGHGADK